jgi:hypothetical protein
MIEHLPGEKIRQTKIVARTGYGIVTFTFTFALVWRTCLFPYPFLSLAYP